MLRRACAWLVTVASEHCYGIKKLVFEHKKEVFAAMLG